jgi:hypothetical protein
MGGSSLTLIDSLSSLVILGDKEGFEKGVKLVVDNVNFDLDAKVQVFEVTIRVLGGLVCRAQSFISIASSDAQALTIAFGTYIRLDSQTRLRNIVVYRRVTPSST